MKNKTNQKRWSHATTKETWKRIQEEGVLWGVDDPGYSRHTYLAKDVKQLVVMATDKKRIWNKDMHHYEVLLRVKYVPNGVDDDYDPKSWEMVVKRPISLENVSFVRYL